MAWALVALLSAATFGVVSILDKQLISRYMPSLACFNFWVGLVTLFYSLVALAVFPIPQGTELVPVLVALGSGVAWGLGIMLMFLALRTEEASRTVAVYHTFPVFVALLAVAFLGEGLVPIQWLAVVVTVAGAILISLRGSPHREGIALNRTFFILLGASLVTAAAHIGVKYALNNLPFWTTYIFRNIGLSLPLLLNGRPGILGQLRQALGHRTTRSLLITAEVFFAPLSVVLTLLAINLGPVSLVSTLTATRPFFVFLYTTALSAPWWQIMDEPLRREVLTVKFASIAMIVGGVSTITLR